VRLESIHQQYRDRVQFLWVYLREAHANDEWAMAINAAEAIDFAQPTTIDERSDVAHACAIALPISMPLVLDDMSDSVANAYSAYPDRLYVVDAGGRVANRGGPGPWLFDVASWERTITELLVESPAS
jgi:Iodothyronine deiodinase